MSLKYTICLSLSACPTVSISLFVSLSVFSVLLSLSVYLFVTYVGYSSSQTNGVCGSSGAVELTDKSPIPSEKQPSPVCRFVNVKLYGVELAQGAKGNQATVLLEIPQGQYLLNLDQLTREVTKNLILVKRRCCYLSRYQFAFVVYFALFEKNKRAYGAEALDLRFSSLLSFMNVAQFSLCKQISGSLEQLLIICYC